MSLQFFEYAAAETRSPLAGAAWADSGIVLTADAAGQLHSWNPLTGHRLPAGLQPTATAASVADRITSIALSAPSSSSSTAGARQLALTSSLGGTLALHALPESYAQAQPPRLLVKHPLAGEKAARSTFASALRPQGDLIVGTGLGGHVQAWRVSGLSDQNVSLEESTTASPSQVGPQSGQQVVWGMSCTFNEDGTQLAIGTRSGLVHLYDVSDEGIAHVSTIASHATPTRALAFTPRSSSYLVAGSDDRLITVHDVRIRPRGATVSDTGADVVACLQGHGGWIRAVAPASGSAGDRLIASASQDGSVRLWDISLSPKTSVFSTPPNLSSPVTGLAWSPVGHHDGAPTSQGAFAQPSSLIGAGAGTGAFVTVSEGNLGAVPAPPDASQDTNGGPGFVHTASAPTSPMVSFFRSASSVVRGPVGLDSSVNTDEALLEDVERVAEGVADEDDEQ